MPTSRGAPRSVSAAHFLRGATLACALAATSLGCAAKRELVIRSDPPGALVRLDDTVVGTTPYTTRFEAYGTRRITLYKPGYRTRSDIEEIDQPWYVIFPLDVVSEILLPFGWRDRHEFDYQLDPESGTVTMPDLEGVLRRAEALRLAEPTGPRPVLPPPRASTEDPLPEPADPLVPEDPVPQIPPPLDPD